MSERLTPDISDCLSQGWELYLKDPVLLSGATVLLALICGAASMVPFLGALVYPPMLAGLYSLIIRLDRGEAITINNLFDGFQRFVPLVIASVLISLLVAVGLILLVLPGLYLIIAYGFTTLLIIDQKQDFWPAMENSRKIINAHFWSYTLLALVLAVICMVASLPLGLGLIIAGPVCIAAQYRYYLAVRALA
ncbi:MAG: hypothetical protein NWP69_02065 [Congregibacter sp.]|nr:hypothetical protein [Congregibacter sp.]MDP5070699.1 hypothetical protein [Congregibacter sp.]